MFKITILFVSVFSSCYCAVEFSDRPRNFSIELLHFTQLQTNGHVVLSPFGIWTLMTGVAIGATDNSLNQLSRAFVLPKNINTLITGYNNLTKQVLDPTVTGVTLTSTNLMFLDKNFAVYPEFQKTIQNDFGASINIMDFKNPAAAEIANKLIKNTGGRVSNVLQSDDFAESRMILTNVISFKGLWASPFNKSDTRIEPFFDENNRQLGKVNMMFQRGLFPFSNIRDMKAFAVEIPYANDKYSMLVLLPHPKVKVTDMYQNFARISLKDIFKRLEDDVKEFDLEEIDVSIPRFQISTNVVLNKPLNDMGVYDIFEPGLASFKRVSREEIFVSAIVHKADIEVTESGTVASAATSAYFADRIMPPKFNANRPFVYFVIEKSTTSVLFSGIYSKPTIY